MIFGGYGKKSKHRGDVFYPCVECGDPLAVHGLVEQYGYGQLYGVRLAKVGTHRFMVCAKCQRGWELSKPQWSAATEISNHLRSVHLTEDVAVASAIALAERVFPDMAPTVKDIFSADPDEVDAGGVVQLPAPTPPQLPAAATPQPIPSEEKICPDCAETVKAAARKCRYCGYRFDDPTETTTA